MPNVFLSHRAEDSETAKTIRNSLVRSLCADVFLSSDAKDLPGGADWRKTIEEKLKWSRWLVLLYSDARENWDWCVYEGAFFLGHHDDAVAANLTVLHPQGTSPPVPFNNKQVVLAKQDDVDGWLRRAFARDAKGQPFQDVSYQSAAGEIAAAVQSLAVRPYASERLLKVSVSAGAQDAPEELSVAGMLQLATFSADAASADVMQTVRESKGENFSKVMEACRFDVEGLCDVVNAVRKRTLTPTVLDLFKSPRDERGYRPVITRADRLDTGAVAIEFMLTQIPLTFDFKTSTGFDLLFHLLAVTARFRWEVIEVFASQLSDAAKKQEAAGKQKTRTKQDAAGALQDPGGAPSGSDGSDIAKREASANILLLRNLQRAVNNAVNEAKIRGLESPKKINDTLVVNEHKRRIKKADKCGSRGLELLETAMTNGDLKLANQALLLLRFANYEYLDVVVSELSRLLRRPQLPSIELLDPEHRKHVGRKAIRNEFRRPPRTGN
jgi:hypothetical protein